MSKANKSFFCDRNHQGIGVKVFLILTGNVCHLKIINSDRWSETEHFQKFIRELTDTVRFYKTLEERESTQY